MTVKLLTERLLEFLPHRLVCFCACQNATLLEITCRGSNDSVNKQWKSWRMWCLIFLCTIRICPTKRTLCSYGLKYFFLSELGLSNFCSIIWLDISIHTYWKYYLGHLHSLETYQLNTFYFETGTGIGFLYNLQDNWNKNNKNQRMRITRHNLLRFGIFNSVNRSERE